MSEIFCYLTKEDTLILLHCVQMMIEIFEERMILFSEKERQEFFSSKNRIHQILEEASKEGRSP